MAATDKHTIILGFKVSVSPKIIELAKEKKITLKNYDIIYRLIEDVQAISTGMIEPETKTLIIGKLEVLKAFYKTHERKLVGGKVVEGKFVPGEKVNIYHSGEIVGQGKVESLQMEKNKAIEVTKGMECGAAIITKVTLKPNDLIEEFKVERIV